MKSDGRNWLPIIIPVALIVIAVPVILVIALRTQDDDNETVNNASQSTVAATPAGGGEGVFVSVSNFKFEPADFYVGNTKAVTFRNTSQTEHRIDIEGDDRELPLAAGATARWIASEPGEFEYHCTIHPNQMKGTITVR